MQVRLDLVALAVEKAHVLKKKNMMKMASFARAFFCLLR